MQQFWTHTREKKSIHCFDMSHAYDVTSCSPETCEPYSLVILALIYQRMHTAALVRSVAITRPKSHIVMVYLSLVKHSPKPVSSQSPHS